MTRNVRTAILCGFLIASVSWGARAEDAEPSYKGDPDVYKVIFEDANLRIIESVRKAGVTDKLHGHPVPSIVYSVTDCHTKQTTPDGKSTQTDSRAGLARPVPVIPAHTATNTGSTDCKQLFIEKKCGPRIAPSRCAGSSLASMITGQATGPVAMGVSSREPHSDQEPS